MSTDELQQLYSFIKFKSRGERTPIFTSTFIENIASEIFLGRQPLPISRDSFEEFCLIQGYRTEDIKDQAISFKISEKYFHYVKDQPAVNLILSDSIDLRRTIRYQSPLVSTFESFLNLLDRKNFAVFFGAGGDDPVPSTDSFIEAEHSKSPERMRWAYLDFAAHFFAPIFGGGQVLAKWLLGTDVKIITTNWSRSIERELVRTDKTLRTYHEKKDRIVSYFNNTVNIFKDKIEVILGDSLSTDKDKADEIVNQSDGLLVFGSTLGDPNLLSWVRSYQSSKLGRGDKQVKLALIVNNDKISYDISTPWLKLIENCESLLPFVRL